MGCCATFRILRTLAIGMSMRRATSSEVGSWPNSCTRLTRGSEKLVDHLDHMYRNANGAGLVGNSTGYCLANPPGCIGRELITKVVVEFVYRLHQAQVALLDQVRNCMPRLVYFLAMETTRRRLASTNSRFARSASAFPWTICRCVLQSSLKLAPASCSSFLRSEA